MTIKELIEKLKELDPEGWIGICDPKDEYRYEIKTIQEEWIDGMYYLLIPKVEEGN